MSEIKENLTRKLNTLFEQLKENLSLDQAAKICKTDISSILAGLKDGSLDPSNVLKCFQYMAIMAHKSTNCLTDFNFNAEKEIAQLKEQNNLKADKMLLYLPVSVKDCFFMKGYASTYGLEKYSKIIVEKNSPIVQCLIDHGAILFCKTNMPQSGLCYITENPLFGTTTNPYADSSLNFTAGGSSGGEAALISYGGSILGLGSDIGGSLRIPATMCGICALKPTPGRVAICDKWKFKQGDNLVRAVSGPMSRSVEGLTIMMRALLSEKMYNLDSTIVPSFFRDDIYNCDRKLKIGHFVGKNNLCTLPCMERVVKKVVELLTAKNDVEFVEWDPVGSEKCLELYSKNLFNDGGKSLKDLLHGETVIPNLNRLSKLIKLPYYIQKTIAFAHSKSKDEVAKALLNGVGGVGSFNNWLDLYQEVYEIRQKAILSFVDNNLDAVILPAFGCPSIPNENTKETEIACWPTVYANFLNFPAGVLPVSHVTEQDLQDIKTNTKKDSCMQILTQMCTDDIVGMPIGCQIMCKPNQEEMVLNIMRKIQVAADFHKKFFFL